MFGGEKTDVEVTPDFKINLLAIDGYDRTVHFTTEPIFPDGFPDKVFEIAKQELAKQGLDVKLDWRPDTIRIVAADDNAPDVLEHWDSKKMLQAVSEALHDRQEDLQDALEKDDKTKKKESAPKRVVGGEAVQKGTFSVLRSGAFRDAVALKDALAISEKLERKLAGTTRPPVAGGEDGLRAAVQTAVGASIASQDLRDRVIGAVVAELDKVYTRAGANAATLRQ